MKALNVILGICLILMSVAIAPIAAVNAAANPQIEAGPDATVVSGAYFTGVVTYTNPSRVLINVSINYGDGSRVETKRIAAGGAGSGSFALFHQYILPAGAGDTWYDVSVSCDYSGTVITDGLKISVITPNQPPSIEPIDDIIINAGQLVTVTVISQDPSHLPVNINGAQLPAGAAMSPTGAVNGTFSYKSTFTWSPQWADIGTHSVLFTSTNTQGLATTIELLITILTVPPTANAGGPYAFKIGDSLTLDGSASLTPYANEGCSYLYEWDIDSNGLYDRTGAVVTLTGAELAGFGYVTQGNTYHPVLKVTDSLGKFTTATANVRIKPKYTLNVNHTGNGNVNVNPQLPVYDEGAVVSLSAIPADGFYFSRWQGDLSGNSAAATLTLDGNKSVTAVFEVIQYTLTVNQVGSGIVNRSTPGPMYPVGSNVSLTAVAAPGFVFDHWEGALTGNGNPASVTVDGDKTVTAVFKAMYTMTVNITGNGTITKSPDQDSYLDGTAVTLTAVPATGYEFDQWQGDASGTSSQVTITLNSNKTVTAVFKAIQYPLTVNVTGSGSVTKTPDGATYVYGTVVTLQAIPADGYYFEKWEGALTGNVNPANVTIDSAKTVNAVFQKTKAIYSLTLNITGNGTITKSPDIASYEEGTVVTLAANPVAGYVFDRWEGSLTGSVSPQTLTMDDNKVVTAVFIVAKYPLTINVTGSGSVTKNPDAATYANGTVVAVTAVPATGYKFDHWTGDLNGANDHASLTMDATKTVSAVFVPLKYGLDVNITGNGTVSKNPDAASYDYNTVVTLTATPAPGYAFTCWEGDLAGSTNPATITLSGNKMVNAVFTINSYPLTVNINGNGSVTKSPDATAYVYGTVVTLNANAANGFKFDRWEGALTGKANPATLTVDAAKTVTAVFVPLAIPTTLTITSSNTLATGAADISALLTIPNNLQLPGKTVTFTIGTNVYTAVTDVNGVATVNVPLASEKYIVHAVFAGDNPYLASNANDQAIYVYQMSQFVIWGGNTANMSDIQVGKSVYFWGAQWWKQVKAGNFKKSNSFKGWASSVSGTGWSTRPGNSSNPPEAIGKYIGVIVSTQIAKDGSYISGNMPLVVIVNVDDPASYDNNPGHEGTGHISAIVQ
ncbi:MAG: InlB B-repeat-containing protein [Dehalococcoidales bacterium]|nr:InlB B-repeat-containing protein [Dehalococcoidales bacterium]